MHHEEGETRPDSRILPLVAVGTALVAAGVGLGMRWPLAGLLVLVVAVAILIFAVVQAARLQKGWSSASASGTGLALVVMLLGMMLSGGGAAWSAVQDPMIGLYTTLAGGVLCAIGVWRLIVLRA